MSTTTTTAAADLTGRWIVDPAATEVSFKTSGFFGLMRVNGTIAARGGTLVVDDAGAATGRIAFDVSTIDTGIRKRDEHLNRADFFHTEKWPEATLTVDRVTATGDGSVVHGELVIRDKPIAIGAPVTVREADAARVVESTVVLDHKAAGLPLRKPLISSRATVSIRLALTPAEA